MTKEQLQIQAAFGLAVKHLEECRDRWIKDAVDNPEDYEGITTDGAYIWFVESF